MPRAPIIDTIITGPRTTASSLTRIGNGNQTCAMFSGRAQSELPGQMRKCLVSHPQFVTQFVQSDFRSETFKSSKFSPCGAYNDYLNRYEAHLRNFASRGPRKHTESHHRPVHGVNPLGSHYFRPILHFMSRPSSSPDGF